MSELSEKQRDHIDSDDDPDPHQPFAAGLARQQPAAERGQHRTGMQRPGGRGGEATTMSRMCGHRAAPIALS